MHTQAPKTLHFRGVRAAALQTWPSEACSRPMTHARPTATTDAVVAKTRGKDSACTASGGGDAAPVLLCYCCPCPLMLLPPAAAVCFSTFCASVLSFCLSVAPCLSISPLYLGCGTRLRAHREESASTFRWKRSSWAAASAGARGSSASRSARSTSVSRT